MSAGKTAIAVRICAHVDRGLPLAGREIDRGKVLFLAGENPDDVKCGGSGFFVFVGAPLSA